MQPEGERHMAKQPLATSELLAMLAAGPVRIAEAAADLTPAQLDAPPAPGEWSANEVLAHLRACADMWGGAIAEIIAHDHPTIRAINPRAWIEKTDYREQAFQASLKAFTTQRADLLAVLEPLAPAGGARGATVTGAGKALERTVHFYAEWMANHERPHLKQIERIATTMRA
jgi:hypothetical protein